MCRYMHYYQRWAENDKARTQARTLAQQAAEGQLHRLSELTATPTSQLKFISDAWDQVSQVGRQTLAGVRGMQLLSALAKARLIYALPCGLDEIGSATQCTMIGTEQQCQR